MLNKDGYKLYTCGRYGGFEVMGYERL